MANTLFHQGTNHHFAQSHGTAMSGQTESDRTKPSRLELLQEDFRSRLLHEREQKANALFEQKVRADLLQKRGSVREFFLNRRMLVSTNERSATSNAVNLPPINSNTRYKGNQRNKAKLVEKQLVDKRKEKERMEAMSFLKDIEKEDSNLSELGKLREKYRKSKNETCQDVPAMNIVKNSSSPSFSSTCPPRGVNSDAGNTTRRKARGVKSREVYKRARIPSHEVETNVNTNSEALASSFTAENEVSKSLVKIKELVHRRKTEEMLFRTRTAKPPPESKTPSPRRNSQSFEEMCKAEVELRETISREQKKLLALQEKQKQKISETMKRNSQRESRGEIGAEKLELKQKEAKQNTQSYETMNKVNTTTNERNASKQKQTKQKQATPRTGNELKVNEGNNLSSADPTRNLITCANCGRGFAKERITKHENACRKASSRKKKPFDAKRKRAEGTDMEKYIIMGKDTTDDSTYKEKKRNWRRTHENFVQSIRSARRQEPQPATPLANPDYIECSYCQRKFKPTVAERHIPRCKDIKARPRPPRR